ncbi:hypothetical protein ACJX0J_026212, partial [Zea mays]
MDSLEEENEVPVLQFWLHIIEYICLLLLYLIETYFQLVIKNTVLPTPKEIINYQHDTN